MAGRGRGRGRGANMSFNIESLGFGRGEALPTANIEPKPTYPALEYKPVPLVESEEQNYLLALKQELRSGLRESPYFVKPNEKRREIERYSDKYQSSSNDTQSLRIDWSRFPHELKIRPKKQRSMKSRLKPRLGRSRTAVADVDKYLEDLEKREGEEVEGSGDETEVKVKRAGGQNAEEDEEEMVEEEELEEEELEDDTDYNMTYFDNGENFAADEDDDLDEGATY